LEYQDRGRTQKGRKAKKRDWFRPKEKGNQRFINGSAECGEVRMGISGNPELIHHPCSEKKGEKVFLVQHDNLKHTIYKSK
jgi:hypothetical protein